MKQKLFFLFLYFSFFNHISSYPCKEITVIPFTPTQISIIKNTTNCVMFSFNNKIEGNIILKLAKSNSFTSKIYIYDDKESIHFNETFEFDNYKYQYQIGREFYKEKKLENMLVQNYYIVIFEPYFYFNDELIIYNDKFSKDNYYEISNIKNNDIKELNFKYDYTNSNPIIIHFSKDSNVINYLSYQIMNRKGNEFFSFYIYKNDLDDTNIIEKVINSESFGNYIDLKGNNEFYIKIEMKGEIDLILRFLESKVLKITPDDIFRKEIVAKMDFYFYIEKELIYENDEYFNEFSIKLDSTNYKNLPFEISTNTCTQNSEEELLKCISESETGEKSVLKRDIDIPYIYHVYYSFNNKDYLVIKISSKNNFNRKQRLVIEGSGGSDYIDEKYDKIFSNNKGYLYPVYLNVSIDNINNEYNNNKNRIIFIYTNTTSAIKIFFNDNSFKDTGIDFKKEEYITIDNYVYGFDFNKKEVQNLFGKRKYFTILIYCPWESSPINFQLTFANHNIHNFKYILDDTRPINSPMKIDLTSPNEKYYFIGQFNELSSNILFNELIYGKINAKYKYFTNDQKISKILYDDTALGKNFEDWIPIQGRIDIIEITCISPSLSYMYFIDDKAININNIILEKGSQNYIYLNNTNYYNIILDQNLKGQKNIFIEVYIVSQVKKQAIDIIINEEVHSLNKDSDKDNSFIRINLGNNNFEKFAIQGKGTATLLKVKIGTDKMDKNIAYAYQYEKELNENIFSKDKKIRIKNNKNEIINLCYTWNFFEEDLLYKPKNENCFNLKGNGETILTMYNPWNKYLSNKNNLFEETDNYYLVVYTEDYDDIKDLEFTAKDESFIVNSEMKENEFINGNNSQFILIKSSNEENKTIFVQISPIIDIDNIINSNNDKFEIVSQFDNNNQKGKIFSQYNRTYTFFDDPLIDSFLSLDIKSEVKYELKYSSISNKNDFKKDKINANYEIELIYENNEFFIKFQPLFKNKYVTYYIIIFFENENKYFGATYLKNIISSSHSDNIYIIKEENNTKEDNIKIALNPDIANKIQNTKNIITLLAEENTYNIIMNYDILKNDEIKINDRKGKTIGFIILMIFLCIFVIALIVIIGFISYYFCLKKKKKKEEDLLQNIKGGDVIIDDDESKDQLNNDEGI